MHKLSILYSRLTLFGSPAAAKIIVPLFRASVKLETNLRKPLQKEFFKFSILYKGFIILIEQTVIEFCRHTSGETAAEYIDEKTANILKKFIKKPRMGIKKKKE
jgi:hypothetical protein